MMLHHVELQLIQKLVYLLLQILYIFDTILNFYIAHRAAAHFDYLLDNSTSVKDVIFIFKESIHQVHAKLVFL